MSDPSCIIVAAASVPSFRVLGVRVHAVQIPDVVAQVRRWIEERTSARFITFTGMHGVTEAHRDPRLKAIHNAADLVVPDGMPLVWLGRRQGHPLHRRVYGPELMETLCQTTGPRFRHFFYGGAPRVAEQLAANLQRRYGIVVAGAYAPPFRRLTEKEEQEVTELVEAAAPDLLWVGLSTPKQEQWMYEHCHRLNVPVMLGVGAAFDFHGGKVKQAPPWMRENGLEWLFRLLQEPKRLWRRYLVHGSAFAWNVSLEILGLRKFQ
jgi:N-acetylglucosaminyldiphosphoundecaprenol N-acetyl-beta-D-mannosaminyltransferase